MDEELRKVVEAILFAAGRKLELAELASLCKKSEEEVLNVLSEWKALLDSSSSPTMLLQDGSAWKLTVREKYVGVIRKVVTKTELPKGQLETLAVVGYKAPVIQSKVVKIRTNKAYEHLAQLENSGFITREKSGRSKLIKLAPKFFEYFDIEPSKLRQKFGSAVEIERAIESKEIEIEQAELAQRKETEERLETPQIVLENGKKPLETYPVVEPVDIIPSGVQLFMEKLGELEVFEIEGEKEVHKKHAHKKKHVKKVSEKSSKDKEVSEGSGEVNERAEEAPEENGEIETTVEEKAEQPIKVEEKAEIEQPVSEEKEETPEEKVEIVEEKPGEKVEPEDKVEKKSKRKKKVEKTEEKEEVVEEKPGVQELTSDQKISKEVAEKTAKLKPHEFEEGKGLFPGGVPPEVEAKIEEKIKRLLSGEPEK